MADWLEKRREMAEHQLKRRGIHDRRVLAAMLEIPREEFVPELCRQWSYCDDPLTIGYGQTISQPYITALMSQCLELKGVETVLEIGAGSGYHAAVLGMLAAKVITIELVPRLAEEARRNLERTGYGKNVRVICGDGSLGYRASMPYDAISVTAAAPEAPHTLLEQLKDPGRMVIPVGTMTDQDLQVITKCRGKLTTRVATLCRFVPLRGKQGWK